MKSHYQRIRRVKTNSGSTAIQVGRYTGKRFKLTKHIGSAKESGKIDELIHIASEYIRSHSPQLEMNFNPHQSDEILFKRGIKVDGLAFLKAKKTLKEVNIPVIAMTNLGHEDVLNACFKLGAKYYILKSEVTPNKVLSVIKEALAK